MHIARTHRSICFALALVLAFAAVAQQAGPPKPPSSPVVSYTPPNYHDVLAGKAPLRVLLAPRLTMLAWKGEGEVRVVSLADGNTLHTAKAGEQIGLVYDPAQSCPALRQNFQNFCMLPPGAPVRLDSEKPIKLWTPTPDTWTSSSAPLMITPLANNRFSVVRQVMLEEYLQTVVPVEMPATFHPQALRAQAVVARTYTLCKLGRHAEDGADLCADVHCQVSGSESKRAKSTDDAVKETRGLLLLHGEALTEPYYHSTCGGVTDDACYVWGPEYARPYLRGSTDAPNAKTAARHTIEQALAAKDPFCKGSNSFRWTRRFTAAEVDALVARNLPIVTGDSDNLIRNVSNIGVESRTPNGRVATLRVEGDGISTLVYGDQARWLFGNGAPGPEGLWSTLFELSVTRDATGAITEYIFHGAGRGHGIGLCQWGANGRGKAGQSFREILHAYYPGTRVSDERK